MEMFAVIILVLIVATGYIQTVKKEGEEGKSVCDSLRIAKQATGKPLAFAG